MSLLMTMMKAQPGATEDENSLTVGFSTGFTGIDIYSGNVEYDIHGIPVINGGLFPRIMNIIGESATGKTTKAIQLVAGAIDSWDKRYGAGKCEGYFKDAEGNTPIKRVLNVTQWTDNDLINKMNYSDKPISLLDLYNEVRRISFVKEKIKNQIMVNTEIRNIKGEEIKIYSPTFIIVDSVAAINPNGIEDFEKDKTDNLKDLETLGNNIDGARDAKAFTAFVRRVKPILFDFNICLIFINHKTSEMITGMFDIPTRYLPFLKPGEKLKGGKEMIYQSFCILDLAMAERIDEKKPYFGDEIRGSIVRDTFVKNKNNAEGYPFKMVFDQKTGFRPELSDWEYISEANYGFGGAPTRYFLDILPEVAFTRKSLINVCRINPLFRKALAFTAKTKMVYSILLHDTPPDLKKYTAFDYDLRVAIIIAFAPDHAGVDCHTDVPESVLNTAANSKDYIIDNTALDLSRSFITQSMDSILTMEEEFNYVPIITNFGDPYSEKFEIDGIEYCVS